MLFEFIESRSGSRKINSMIFINTKKREIMFTNHERKKLTCIYFISILHIKTHKLDY